jgi:hypothetical protein
VPYTSRYNTNALALLSSNGDMYYSFNVGPVHVIILDSQGDYLPFSDQWVWLKSDLAAVNREITPWVIACFHLPFYNSNKASQLSGETMRLSFETIFYTEKVNLVITGHVHAYERCTNTYDAKIDANAPIYITVGNGGNPVRFLRLRFSLSQTNFRFRKASR